MHSPGVQDHLIACMSTTSCLGSSLSSPTDNVESRIFLTTPMQVNCSHNSIPYLPLECTSKSNLSDIKGGQRYSLLQRPQKPDALKRPSVEGLVKNCPLIPWAGAHTRLSFFHTRRNEQLCDSRQPHFISYGHRSMKMQFRITFRHTRVSGTCPNKTGFV